MKPGLESTYTPQFQWEKIKEESSIRFGGERDHLPFGVRGGLIVDVLQVGSLAAQPGAIVDNLAVDFARCVVDESQSESFLKERMAKPKLSLTPR